MIREFIEIHELRVINRERGLEREVGEGAYLRPVSPPVAWESSVSAATGDATERSRGAAGAKP